MRILIIIFICCFTKGITQENITYNNYGVLFKKAQNFINEGNYEEGANLHYDLLQFLENQKEDVKDSVDVWRTKNYYSITRLYLFQDNSLSIKYADSTINSALRTKEAKLIQRGYSIKYYCLYDVEGKENELNALADYCIQYAKEANNNDMLAESYMHKCNALMELGESEDAFTFCEKAENLFKISTQEKYLASVYNNIANVFVKGNEIEKALEYYHKAHQLNIKLNNLKEFNTTAKNIAEKNKTLGNYKTATEFYKKYSDSINSYYSNLLKTNFYKADAKYQSQLKDKEIAQQELEIARQKNTRNYWIIGSLVFLLIGFSLFQWSNNKQKRKKILAEANFKREQEINELRSKFLGNIAHEIRTPLTLILGNLDLALENFENKEKAKKNINTALLNSKKVMEDANEILELLKFEKNKATISLTSIKLNETLKRIFLSFESLAEIKQIELNYQTSIPDNLFVQIDVEKIEKIVNNLISNAIKYSPSNSRIIFEAAVEDKLLTIKIIDSGQGIHFNETEKIFERFYQSSESQAVGGIGIGLSLAKEFTELLKGTLSVESVVGDGSTFIFTIPIDKTVSQNQTNNIIDQNEDENVIANNKKQSTGIAKNKLERLPSNEVHYNNRDKPKVLIVEDNPEMCAYIVEILSNKYKCTTAFDGKEALLKIEKESFDLITSDIMMPKLDGFQLRKKLNESELLKNIPFILISAKTLEEDKIKGFQLGIDDYIVKPFNKNELIARIDNLLINKNSREQWKIHHEDFELDENSSDQKLLKKTEAIVIENISDENFKVVQLATEIGYSQRQLSRLINKYTGMSPVKFILEIRLQKAYRILQNKTFFTLSEVRYDVGILTSSYFNRKFKERFGISPSKLLS